MALAAEADVDVVMAHAFSMQTVADAHRGHQIRRELFQHAGAHAIDHVFVIAPLQNHRIDPLQVQ